MIRSRIGVKNRVWSLKGGFGPVRDKSTKRLPSLARLLASLLYACLRVLVAAGRSRSAVDREAELLLIAHGTGIEISAVLHAALRRRL